MEERLNIMTKEEFEREVIRFMGRIDEHMLNQGRRCDSHALDIRQANEEITRIKEAVDFRTDNTPQISDRVKTFEHLKERVTGALKVVGWTLGTGLAAWALIFELVKGTSK